MSYTSDKTFQLLSRYIGGSDLIKAVFSNKRKKGNEFDRVTMRRVKLKEELMIQVEYAYPKKVTHDNIAPSSAISLAFELSRDIFKQVNITTLDDELQILCNKTENPKLTHRKKDESLPADDKQSGSHSPYAASLNLENDRKKNYIIPDGSPCDFLIRLGVMSEDGNVFQKGYRKFRQINRYLEIVEDCYPYLSSSYEDKEKKLRIIDFGCGKAYLTFALYHYLHNVKNRDVEIIGLDLKDDVIRFCSEVANELHYDGLKFMAGDIAKYVNDRADMVVTLHACDTATDYALINAVNWHTRVILSVPCCQHELFKQIKNDIHEPMLKHGILKDRLTEYLTDGLRALKLESAGYDVAMIEFTSLEHTARNIMIKAIRSRPNKSRMDKAQDQYERLCEFYQVHPAIDSLGGCVSEKD